MNWFKKRNHNNLPPLSPYVKVNNRSEVLETIDGLGIPREEFVIVGSAALTLLELERHAHDVDLVVHPSVLGALAANGRLPNGIVAHENVALSNVGGGIHFRAGTVPLPTEFNNYTTSFGALSYKDFVERYAQDMNGVNIIQPSLLARSKSDGVRVGDDRLRKLAQDKYDLELIYKLYEKQFAAKS